MSWQTLSDFATQHQHLAGLITVASFIMILSGILLTPIVMAAIPQDYFASEKRPGRNENEPLILYIIRRLLKNIVGVLLIFCGILMLVLPGQGLLTLAVGLLLTDYPGKFKFEKAFFSQPKILNSINWMRRKQGKQNLTM